MNSYIITGGSGFVGNILIGELLKRDDTEEIINIDLKPSRYVSNRIKNFECDITDLDKQRNIIIDGNKCYKLFHLAANIFNESVPKRKHRRSFFFDTNVKGTSNLFKLFNPSSIESVSFLSTDMVYGYPVNIPINEIDSLKPNGEYGESKIYAEDEIINFCGTHSIQYNIFRPRLIIGPGRFGLLNKLFFLIKHNLPVPLIGDGSNRYQFISVFDCVNALILSIELRGCSGIYNLGSINPPTTYDLLSNLITYARSKSILIRTNPNLIKKTLSVLDAMNLSLMYPEQYLIADYDYILSIDKLINDLKYQPKFNDQDMIISAYETYLKT